MRRGRGENMRHLISLQQNKPLCFPYVRPIALGHSVDVHPAVILNRGRHPYSFLFLHLCTSWWVIPASAALDYSYNNFFQPLVPPLCTRSQVLPSTCSSSFAHPAMDGEHPEQTVQGPQQDCHKKYTQRWVVCECVHAHARSSFAVCLWSIWGRQLID